MHRFFQFLFVLATSVLLCGVALAQDRVTRYSPLRGSAYRAASESGEFRLHQAVRKGQSASVMEALAKYWLGV